MGYIYIISDPAYEKLNRYKVGMTFASHGNLLGQYIRFIPEVNILYYQEVSNPRDVEYKILDQLNEYRVRNKRGSLSEWVIYDYSKLVRLVNKVIKEEEAKAVKIPREETGENPQQEIAATTSEPLDKLTVAQLRELHKKLGKSSPPRRKSDLIEAIEKLRKGSEAAIVGIANRTEESPLRISKEERGSAPSPYKGSETLNVAEDYNSRAFVESIFSKIGELSDGFGYSSLKTLYDREKLRTIFDRLAAAAGPERTDLQVALV
jgi:hypothetical protein